MTERPLFAHRGLYGIAGPTRGVDPLAETLALATALLDGGSPVLQLRDKTGDGRALLQAARALRRLTRERGACFIVNDRLDIALMAEADGVHVGQDDLPVEDVRRVAAQVGRADLIVGLSTHDLEQVRQAGALDVDYLGFGPVFGTTTKADALQPRGLGLLGEAKALSSRLPVVAIGGISFATAGDVARTGVAMAAVIGDIVGASNPSARSRELHHLLGGASP